VELCPLSCYTKNRILLYNKAKTAATPISPKAKPPRFTVTASLLVPVPLELALAVAPPVAELLDTTTSLTTPVAALVPKTFPAAAHGVLVNESPDNV
jgi:hypothetical protein